MVKEELTKKEQIKYALEKYRLSCKGFETFKELGDVTQSTACLIDAIAYRRAIDFIEMKKDGVKEIDLEFLKEG